MHGKKYCVDLLYCKLLIWLSRMYNAKTVPLKLTINVMLCENALGLHDYDKLKNIENIF